MKKVLVVASVVSFIEWFNQENIDYLKHKLKCDVHIACDFDYFDDTDEKRTRKYIKKLKKEGIILYNIKFSRFPFSIKNIKAYNHLKKIIHNERFDLIHTHTPTASIMVRLASVKARKNGTIVMYSSHGFHFHNKSSKKNWLIYYPIEKYFSRHCDYIVTINKEDYKRALKFKTKNVRYIPSVGVEINKIKNMEVDRNRKRSEIGVPEEAILIISAGELIKRKNHEIIIKSLSKIEEDNLFYVIAGKGPLRQKLEKLSIKLGLEDRVIFLGFRTDIFELYHSADLSAFPSLIEGLGLSGIEAMAAGLPLISSNVHGILDYVIDGETGFACNPRDVNCFADSIKKIIYNEKMYYEITENVPQMVIKYEKVNALRKMWNIYDEILIK